MRTTDRSSRRLVVEAVTLGVGYASVLCWASVALVASFGRGLGKPYWPDLTWLRTDVTGVAAFGLAAVCLAVSRYLGLRRTRGQGVPRHGADVPAAMLALQAVAETAAVLATGAFAYLSFNAVTHYYTLRLQLTHLWPWPSEGTVRVIALGICAVSVAIRHFLRAAARGGSAGRNGQRLVFGHDGVRQVEQAAAEPDLESRLGR